jgi:hypothetical protein
MTTVTRVLLFFLVLSSTDTWADKAWHLQPRLTSGVQFYTLDQTAQTDIDGAKLDAETPAMVILGIGGSIIYDAWYLDIHAQRAESTAFGSTSVSSSEQQIERTDFSISVGRQLPFHFSAFAGYKMGATHKEEDIGISNEDPNSPNGDVILSFSTRFVVKGPFLGVSYGLPLGDKSLASATLAYGLLDATLDSNLPFPPPESAPVTDTGSSGLSYGLALKTVFYKNYLLTNAINCQTYNFAFDYPSSRTHFEITEKLCNLALSLGYSF